MQQTEPLYFVGIDIGTSSAKAVAFSERGEVLNEASSSYKLERPETDAAVQDPGLIYQAIRDSLRSLVRQMGYPPRSIGLSSAMHSIMAVDQDGKPLSPLITWADGRARHQAEALRGTELGTRLYHRSGTPIHAMSPLCKLAWLQETKPAVFRAAHRFIGIKEYLVFRLSGQWVIDHSIASATGLFDLQERQWIPEALQYSGVAAHQLSTPVPGSYNLPALSADDPGDIRTYPQRCGCIGR